MSIDSSTNPTHPISQICVVVNDIDKTMYEYSKRLGWGPWSVFEYGAPLLHDTYLRGVPTPYTMIGAEVKVGDMGFELIQPTSGHSIYQEFLDAKGEGVQHIAVMKHSPAESDAFLADMEVPKLMGGFIGDDIEFYYLDTEVPLKVSVESGTGHAIALKPTRYFSLD
jgi:methylmalonyl-CoA/ethylmalonyl-CoA epimerase